MKALFVLFLLVFCLSEAGFKAEAEEAVKLQKEEFKTAISGFDQGSAAPKIVPSDSRFERFVSGMVRDTKSGLDWYAGPDKNTSWDDAKSWTENLRIYGGGWRMPTRSELKSLYQKGTGSRNMTPMIMSTGWFVWSGEAGTGQSGGDGKAWAIDFGDGRELLERRVSSNYKRGFAVRSASDTLTLTIDPAGYSISVIASDGRYEKIANGMVRDAKSGLEWYAGPDKNIDSDDAKRWIEGLEVAGGGWRMPVLNELKSLYQKGAGSRNMTPLLETTGWFVWSDETEGVLLGYRGAFDFDKGRDLMDKRGNSQYKRVFAVRAAPGNFAAADDPELARNIIVGFDSRFDKFGSGVVRDKKSGLDWYAGPDKNTSQAEARAWVNSLKVDGGGWRMPTLKELKGLYQKGSGIRNMTPMLGTTGWWIWSGEGGMPGPVWALDFSDGREFMERRDSSNYKRGFAVRLRR